MGMRTNKKGKTVQEYALLDTEKGLIALQKKVPPDVFAELKKLKNKGFAGETEFMEAVEARLREKTPKYKRLILKYTDKDPKHFCYYCSNQIPHADSGCHGMGSFSHSNKWYGTDERSGSGRFARR